MSAQNSSAARQARFFYAIHLCVVSFFPLQFATLFRSDILDSVQKKKLPSLCHGLENLRSLLFSPSHPTFVASIWKQLGCATRFCAPRARRTLQTLRQRDAIPARVVKNNAARRVTSNISFCILAGCGIGFVLKLHLRFSFVF